LIDGASFLLTEAGQLAQEKESVILPAPVMDVWAPEQAAALLDGGSRAPLSQHVEAADRAKLLKWGVISEVTRQQVLGVLQNSHLPKPETWRQLLRLWGYVSADITSYRYYVVAENVRIVPVQGKEVLYGASEVVRLGEKKLLQSAADWEFLARYLIVLDQNWPRFLAEQRRAASEHGRPQARESVEEAYAVLVKIGLSDSSDAGAVIEQVAVDFFSQEDSTVGECVQLAHISAKLGARAGAGFRYVVRNLELKALDAGIFFDQSGALEELIPDAYRESHLLHADYSVAFESCSQEEWLRWIDSGASGLLTCIPLVQRRISAYGKPQIEREAERRSVRVALTYPYVSDHFFVEDWDFEDSYWQHWKSVAAHDERVWVNLAEGLLAQRDQYWSRARTATIVQVASNGRTRSVTSASLLPSWALRLREQACLLDTRGVPRKPDELLRRTSETESLMDVEIFIHARLDRESTRPLLELLGVRSTPTGPERLLDCLRTLAKSKKAPAHEVEKWYRRLDQMVDTCSTNDLLTIREAFRKEKMILAEDGSWVVSSAVFLSAEEEDVPGAALIRPAVRELALWRKIGVADRPTAELAVDWLKALPSGGTLSQDEARRVRGLLGRHPVRIWEECGHWLNLAGEWVPTEALAYAFTMQSLIPWSHLHQWVKQRTADLQRLPGEATGNPPFSKLPLLSAHVEERLQKNPILATQPVKMEWLYAFGSQLRRVDLDGAEETQRVRSLADTVAETSWVEAPRLEIMPYIGGTPAGTSRHADVVWLGQTLYVGPLPKAKLARRVPEEIGRVFARPDVRSALDYSFARSAEDVRAYIEENFRLAAQGDAPTESIKRPSDRVAGLPDTLTEPEPGARGREASSSVEDGDGSLLMVGQTAILEVPTETHGGGKEGTEDVDALRPRKAMAPKSAKPTIIERFAIAQGYRKDMEGRFFHENGGWIGRANGQRFPWECRTAGGDLVCYYLPKEHCLERDPLPLEADIWSLIQDYPSIHALVLADIQGNPLEVTGERLLSMRDKGEIILYPASYRLVYDQERHA
jgi:hypothetical protein